VTLARRAVGTPKQSFHDLLQHACCRSASGASSRRRASDLVIGSAVDLASVIPAPWVRRDAPGEHEAFHPVLGVQVASPNSPVSLVGQQRITVGDSAEIVMRGSHLLRMVASLMALCVATAIGSSTAAAQNRHVEVGGHVSILRVSEFDVTDVGVGASVVWPLTPVVAIDGAFTWFPGAGDGEADQFENQHRTLGLVGLRAAITHRDVELFARARAGLLRFGDQGSVVCIAIVPVPLGCQLAAGYTAFAAGFGAGVSVGLAPAGRLRVRIEAGDLLVRYGLDAERAQGQITEGFLSHNPLVTIGLGWRF